MRGHRSISVVIPTRGVSDRLVRCLEAMTGQTREPDEIVVVATDADPADPVFEKRPHTTVIQCVGSFSFARVANIGIAASRGEWVLLLNDDVVPAPQFLERLLDGIPPDHERIGMVCGRLLAGDGRTIDSTGQFLSRARTASERGYRCADVGQFNEPGEVFSAPGAAALYRRRMLEAVAVRGQYFDERFGMYLEDLELGWRAQRAGWRAFYVPGAVALHTRGATAKTQPPRWSWLRRYYLPWLPPKRQARYILNRYRLMARYDGFPQLLRYSPWILWYELKQWAYLLCVERQTVRLIARVLRRAALAHRNILGQRLISHLPHHA